MVDDNEQKLAEIITNLINNESDYLQLKHEAQEFFINNFSERKSIELWKKALHI